MEYDIFCVYQTSFASLHRTMNEDREKEKINYIIIFMVFNSIIFLNLFRKSFYP